MISYKFLLKIRTKGSVVNCNDVLQEDLAPTGQLTKAQLQGTSALFWLPLAADMHAHT